MTQTRESFTDWSSIRSSAHPLQLLSEDEVRRAVALLRQSQEFQQTTPRVRFVNIALHEPPKSAVLGFDEGTIVAREVVIVLLDAGRRESYEAIVSLDEERIVSWRGVPGMQPAALVDELERAEGVVKANPDFQSALRKRGIHDFDRIQVDPWPAGNFGYQDEEGRRLARAVAYVKLDAEDNAYARPIEGVIVLVDLFAMQVLRVEDHGVVPIPPEGGKFTAESVRETRKDLKPLEISQPEGIGAAIVGNYVTWQKWHFRVGFTPREGLVLHLVGYEDKERVRPIIYRASLSEMVVPYGDPSPTHYFKNAFDAGENGVGMAVNGLERGCDCLGEIHYFDVSMGDAKGNARTVHNAVCMHEEDYGILWKHLDWRSGEGEVRRSRRLVVSSWSSIGNYDYGFFWYFYQDGTIEYEVKLTGVLSTGAVPPGERPKHGALVAPQLNGVSHQHYFNVRLDMHVDGLHNSVHEVNSRGLGRGPENPHGNAFVTDKRVLADESVGARVIDPLAARSWHVVNPSQRNRLGESVGYRLVPGENVLPYALPDSSIVRRATFITKHLWVTAYEASEKYAAGDFPYQHAGGAGLPTWQKANRPIVDEDVVVWYSFGHHHVPRPEDWPVMPTAYIGFTLKPVGFFDRNPALDVPRPPHGNYPGSERG